MLARARAELGDHVELVGEALRVVRPSGAVLTAFSAKPSARRATLALIESVMRPGFAGRFLSEQERPLHTCTKHCAHRWDYGLTTVAMFGKACHAATLVPELAGARRQ